MGKWNQSKSCTWTFCWGVKTNGKHMRRTRILSNGRCAENMCNGVLEGNAHGQRIFKKKYDRKV